MIWSLISITMILFGNSLRAPMPGIPIMTASQGMYAALSASLAEAPRNVEVIVPEKQIALTFDDGPYGTATASILSILESQGVPASFFMIGKNAEEYPGLVKRIRADGFVIGNHSYRHAKDLADMSAGTFEADLLKAEAAISQASGVKPDIFRPPYGLISNTMKAVLKKDGYGTAFWNIDADDWDDRNSSTTIASFIEKHARDNAIILLHDGRDTHVGYPRDNLIGALPSIIANLRQHRYTFVTVDKILNDKPYFGQVILKDAKTGSSSASASAASK